MTPIRTLIMGAAGRDFHNFNVFFRDNQAYEVVAFTATQIPNIEGRRYPAGLAGSRYPEGIPIFPESDLERLIAELKVDQVIFAYSDVPHEYVMHKASLVLAAGADFCLMGMKNTQIKSIKPVVSVCAVRTGSGKSQTTRRVSFNSAAVWVTAWRLSATLCHTATWLPKKSSASLITATWINKTARLKSAKNMSLTLTMG